MLILSSTGATLGSEMLGLFIDVLQQLERLAKSNTVIVSWMCWSFAVINSGVFFFYFGQLLSAITASPLWMTFTHVSSYYATLLVVTLLPGVLLPFLLAWNKAVWKLAFGSFFAGFVLALTFQPNFSRATRTNGLMVLLTGVLLYLVLASMQPKTSRLAYVRILMDSIRVWIKTEVVGVCFLALFLFQMLGFSQSEAFRSGSAVGTLVYSSMAAAGVLSACLATFVSMVRGSLLSSSEEAGSFSMTLLQALFLMASFVAVPIPWIEHGAPALFFVCLMFLGLLPVFALITQRTDLAWICQVCFFGFGCFWSSFREQFMWGGGHFEIDDWLSFAASAISIMLVFWWWQISHAQVWRRTSVLVLAFCGLFLVSVAGFFSGMPPPPSRFMLVMLVNGLFSLMAVSCFGVVSLPLFFASMLSSAKIAAALYRRQPVTLLDVTFLFALALILTAELTRTINVNNRFFARGTLRRLWEQISKI